MQKRMPFLRGIAAMMAASCTWSFALAGPVIAARQAEVQPRTTNGVGARAFTAAELAKLQARSLTAVREQKQDAKHGYPYLKALAAREQHPQPVAAPPQVGPSSFLDEVGHLSRPVSIAEMTEWKAQLAVGHLTSAQVAQLQIWLGEWKLGHDRQPEAAIVRFEAAKQASLSLGSKRRNSYYGLSSYDTAVALFHMGAYRQATDAFRDLTSGKKGLAGYNHATASLWLRHAVACAGYHAERAALGIPEPTRLDPQCGAAALAACLRALKMPYSRATVLAHCRVTGEGSSLRDVLNAADKLGVSAHALTADADGLKKLPKPLVAYVEHDHFVALVRADNDGVSYLCSDCGMWPGGLVNLTWKQWNQMNGGLYVAVTKRGGTDDAVLSALINPETSPTENSAATRVATIGNLSGLHMPLNAIIGTALNGMRGHVFRELAPVDGVVCGATPIAQHCDTSVTPCCPKSGGGPGGPGGPGNPGGPGPGNPRPMAEAAGPASGDPVNLATGEEEYTPAADLEVFNPVGPSVAWSRLYNSLRGPGDSHSQDPSGHTNVQYEDEDFGTNWSTNYNIGVYDPNYAGGGDSGTAYIQLPNGARVQFTIPTTQPTQGHPVQCTPQAGAPYLIWKSYSATSPGGTYDITLANRKQYVTTVINPKNNCYQLAELIDRNGNAISFNYAAGPHDFNLLTSIVNGLGTTLLSINRVADGTGNIASISDCYGRTVYYHEGAYLNPNVPSDWPYTYWELDHVSQIVASCTADAPDRYAYGYQEVSNGEYSEEINLLHTITVPSPTGTGNATSTINYQPDTDFVSSTVDANGNQITYASVNSSGGASYPSNYTQVEYLNSGNTEAYTYRVGYDNNMSETSETNGNTTNVWAPVYSDPNDPYMPSSVGDGNGNVTHYTHNQYGNTLTTTSPRGTVTTYTMSYANFAMGELTSAQVGTKPATSYAYYEPSGLLHTVTGPLPGTVGSTQTVQTSYVYDTLGNLTSFTTPGNNSATTLTSTVNYTTDGSYQQAECIGEPLTVTDSLGHITHFRYDVQGNQTTLIDALGNETDTVYNIANQSLTATYPPTGQTGSGREKMTVTYLYPGGPDLVDNTYDESGNLARQRTTTYGLEGEMLTQTGDLQSTAFSYDSTYRLATMTDGNGHAITNSYNAMGYLAERLYPNGTSVTFPSYDNDGNLLERIDQRGVQIDYEYNDPESKLTNVNYPTDSAVDVVFTYDQYGRKTGMTDGSGVTSYVYDDNDNQTTVKTTYTGLPEADIVYAYYPNGTVQSTTTPAGVFSYDYIAGSRMESVTNPFGESTSWTYLNNGWLQTQNVNGVVSTTYTTDARGEVTELKNTNGATTLSDFSGIGYTGAGLLDKMTASLPAAPQYSGSVNYTYDGKRELTGETAPGVSNSFLYDSAGNPTTIRSVAGHTYDKNNQITNTGFAYDASGNPTTYKSTSLTFDPENRLTSYGTVMSAGYRGDGLRAWKQNSSGRTYFLYDGARAVCELNSSGGVTATNTFGGGALLSRHTGSGSTFYAFDPRGNASERVSSTGAVLTSQTFDSYGLRGSTDSNTDPFAGYGGVYGYYTDYETGLSALGHRYYDPGQGRFLTMDPVGVAGGMNQYEYGDNSPIGESDPSGFAPPIIPGKRPGLDSNLINGVIGCINNIIGPVNNFDPSNPDAGNGICKAIIACLAGILSSAISALIQTVVPGLLGSLVGGCAGGFVSNYLGCISAGLCPVNDPCKPRPSIGCLAQNCLMNGLIGCLGGMANAVCRPIDAIDWYGYCRAIMAEVGNGLKQIFGLPGATSNPGC